MTCGPSGLPPKDTGAFNVVYAVTRRAGWFVWSQLRLGSWRAAWPLFVAPGGDMLRVWVESYKEDCYALSAGTRELYAYHLDAFVAWSPSGILMSEVTPAVLRSYMAGLRRKDGRPYSPHYVDQVYRTLHTFLAWVVREGGVESNPLDHVRRPRVPRTKSPRLTLEEVERLLEAVKSGSNPARDLAMVCLAVDSGLRRGEIIGLELDHVDLGAGVVRVIGKGGKEREVPVGSFSLGALRTYLALRRDAPTKKVFLTRQGRPFTRNGAQTLMYRLKVRAGLPQLRWHLLRHHFGNFFVANGGGLRKLQKILGHASVDTTARIYTDPELGELVQAHARCSPFGGMGMNEER